MIIANPIYDVVFKHLMENIKIAKFLIGTLIDEPIEDLTVKPQELTYSDELAGLKIYRLDFLAKIKLKKGQYKNVLIEIQKARNYVDLMRFRNYLAEQYKKEDEIEQEDGTVEKMPLPIITIYFLGFTLEPLKSSAIKVNRIYLDLITGEEILHRDEFIENLTHDSYVVQIPQIKPELGNKVSKLLSVFEQDNFIGDKKSIKDYTYPVDDDALKEILELLNKAGETPEVRKEIEKEEEAMRVLDVATHKYRKKIIQYLREIDEHRKTLEDTNRALEDKSKALEDQSKVLEDTSKALEDQSKALENTKKTIEDKDKIIEELQRKLKGE